MIDLLTDPLFGIVAFLAAGLLIAITNAIALARIDRRPTGQTATTQVDLPKISVLIPARNEELNIENCIQSLLSQDYPNFEILALDDLSTDRTCQILEEIAAANPRLQVLKGKPLPEGWLGKNWACHQLSQAAVGELILFVDADTAHQPGTLNHFTSILIQQELDMLTALPRQIVISWGERLVVPILYFSLMIFLPLPLAYRLRLPVFSAAIGQFMLFRREAYDTIGGYAAVRLHGTDDLALARQVKQHNLPWRLANGSNLTSTRMYRNFRQVYHGFSKNLFAAFEYRVLPFLFAWLWMGYLFFRPWVELAYRLSLTPDRKMEIGLCLLAILQAFLLWGLVVWLFRFPRGLFLFYPAIVFMGVWIALRSVWLSLRGKAEWKGRRLDRPKIRWI